MTAPKTVVKTLGPWTTQEAAIAGLKRWVARNLELSKRIPEDDYMTEFYRTEVDGEGVMAVRIKIRLSPEDAAAVDDAEHDA